MTRVIAVLGASNVGKSTLVDRFAALEGAAHPAATPGEARVVGFDHLGDRWQAIDTPGSVEFLPVALGGHDRHSLQPQRGRRARGCGPRRRRGGKGSARARRDARQGDGGVAVHPHRVTRPDSLESRP